MIALFVACARGFGRDRAGLVMTLLLPPLVFLLFAAIFGAGARGDLDTRVALFDGARDGRSVAVAEGLRALYGDRLAEVHSLAELEAEVLESRADAGVALADGRGADPEIEVVSATGREVAAAAVEARVGAVVSASRGETRLGASVDRRAVGPDGDVQAVYYAGAVSVMFVFFAAMHGAMTGLDERRSGLQARLSLLGGGLTPVMAGRFAWLAAVGLMQSAIVFAMALPRLPALAPWQGAAWLVSALLAAAAAAGAALAVVGLCRTRDQAQPLSTFLVLLLAALGGSMAPRFLMPEVFRALGWATPHAWTIEAYQAVVWRGTFDLRVAACWIALAAAAAVGFALALILERRRMRF